MKTLTTLTCIALVCLLFFSCQKETSVEQGTTVNAAGTLVEDAVGNCSSITLNGIFKAGVVMANTNYLDVTVNVGTAGFYLITTDTLNGIYFNSLGSFASTGNQTIRLAAHGTPVAVGAFSYTVSFNGTSSCTVNVNVSPAGTTTAAFSLDGSPGSCTTPTIQGTYTANTALGPTNKIIIAVNVSTPGDYTLTTGVVNGISFSATGTFATIGAQTVTLSGTGTPTSAGTNSMSISGTAASCSFPLTINPASGTPANFTLNGAPGSCATPTIQGTFTSGTVLNSANKIVINVNVTSVGDYSLSTTTVNGFSFSGTGTFVSTGAQTVTLTGTGTPIASGATTFSINGAPAGCSFSITVNPTTSTSNARLFYSGGGSNGSIYWSEIYSANLDGSNEQKLTNFSNNGTIQKWAEFPSFNEDSTKLIFTVSTSIYDGILMSMNLDGSGQTSIAPPLGNNVHHPFVYQNGQKVVFEVDTVNGPHVGQIFTSNINGTNLQKITDCSLPGGFPDGSCLTPSIGKTNIVLYNEETSGIWAMNVDGTNKHQLRTNPFNCGSYCPRFSPDQTKIVFSGQVAFTTHGHEEVFIMNADGSGVITLTSYSNNGTLGKSANFPCFSPDGNYIYYAYDGLGGVAYQQIFRMNLDGSNKTQITSGTIQRYFPLVK